MPCLKSGFGCAGVLMAIGLATAASAQVTIAPSAVEWSHVLTPALNDQQPIIDALPTAGTVVYDNITTWRRGITPGFPETLMYQEPGNDEEIWTGDDLHLTTPTTLFNEVHFVIRTFSPDRPISLAFWPSDNDLGWPDAVTPAPYLYELTLPETIPSEDYATLVKVTLPEAIDLGSHMWMGLQSIVEGEFSEQIAFSAATPAVGWSSDWWSQSPGTQMQNPFFNIPGNFAYGLSYTIPAPAAGVQVGLLAFAAAYRRRRA